MDAVINNLKVEIDSIESKIKEIESLKALEQDNQIKALYDEEINSLGLQREGLIQSLNALTEGSEETHEDRTSGEDIDLNTNVAILELRAGTGGDEAGLFAQDLYNMYLRFAEQNNWKTEEIFLSKNEAGGIKTATSEIRGIGCYDLLKNESGVHRVQRVPVTESGGRIHTSTATVAILPKLKKVNIDIKPEDLKWEFFRAGGHGGQNVNKVSTAVRLIHLPTNTVVECQEERTQGKNRDKALSMLSSKLYTMMNEQKVKQLSDLRYNQVGTGERNEKIRTYNFPQDRVTDHRVKMSWHNMNDILNGNILAILEGTKDYKED